MIPHILENQSYIEGLNGYPLGPLIIVVGFVLVLLVEHVLLDVHVATNSIFSTTEEKSKEMTAVPQFHHISQPRQVSQNYLHKCDCSLSCRPFVCEGGTSFKNCMLCQREPVQPEQTFAEKWSAISHAALILVAISIHALLEALALGLEVTH